ncbi:MAG: acetyl-CoA carboxylase biotin carboxyl carrier protein subunit, partial [FCB group bacterium]|nr:acetyl-CoA carboxylase biotin carboxyl carrier protein subunit [FCB group bacterium]
GHSLEVDIHSNGYDNRKTVFLKGREITVDIEDYNLAQLRKTAGLSSDKMMDRMIKAPMPGLILDVKVTAGDTVEKGQPLLIIEAMKMENIIKASGKAVVKEVLVKNGASVDKGSKLLELE